MKTVKFHYNSARPLTAGVLAVLLFVIAVMQPVTALAKGYATDDSELRPGMVVALSESGSAEEPKVERAALEKETKVIGVTTTPDDQLVTITQGSDQVYVQNTGEVQAFVSDLNGQIRKGDLLAPSPLLGILMRADESTAPIVGIALEDFDTASQTSKQIKEDNGSKDVKISTIRINLDHMAASNQQASATDSSLERLGRAVVGKDVGEIQVLSALIVFLVVLIAEGGIIYGAVSSAISALGRNPMAREIIRREMFRVIMIAFFVLGTGVGAVYAILWI